MKFAFNKIYIYNYEVLFMIFALAILSIIITTAILVYKEVKNAAK